MAATRRRQTTTRERDNRESSIDVTLLYEDLPAALRAQALFDCVTAERPLPVRIDFEFWRFDFLRDAALRAEAARMAERSAIVIVSARNQRALPPQLDWCVNEWLEYPQRHARTFAVLFANAAHSAPSSVDLSQWRKAARLKDVDFFCEMPAGSLNECFKAKGGWANTESGQAHSGEPNLWKMQYASDEGVSSALCNGFGVGSPHKYPIFTGDKGPPRMGTITAKQITQCQKSKQCRLKSEIQRMPGGDAPSSAIWPAN